MVEEAARLLCSLMYIMLSIQDLHGEEAVQSDDIYHAGDVHLITMQSEDM